jgi:hypothetical protein
VNMSKVVHYVPGNHERKVDQKRAYRGEFGSHWRQCATRKKGGLKRVASSSTTGIAKNIHPTPLQKGICARNRSYKNPNYEVIMASIGRKTVAK